MKYAIENTSGQWWTGSCWGVEQAREEYDSIEELPEELPDCSNDDMIECSVYNEDPDNFDVRYDNVRSRASVRIVRGRSK